MINKKRFKGVHLVLVISMILSSIAGIPFNALAADAENTIQEMALTEENISNATKYDTYYYSDNVKYTYNNSKVSFISNDAIEVNGEKIPFKNKKTNVSIEQSEDTIKISLSDLSIPVSQISGAWNSTYQGKKEIVYNTNIPGMEEVRSSGLDSPITLTGVEPGNYTLTNGQVFEKANEWSPGYDFNDNKGVVKERYFGTLPNIHLKVVKESATISSSNDNGVTSPSSNEDSSNGDDDSDPALATGYLGTKTEARVYDDFTNDLWLQYQQKSLAINDTVDLRPWRVEQIVSNGITNDVARPNFNFEIISGDSVTLSDNNSSEKTQVKAVKAGTSVVKVTYDALEYKGKTWAAISPVNTAYAVFVVGQDGKATIKLSDELMNWRHYDTIYYSEGATTPYTFNVDAKDAKSIRVLVNGIEVKGTDNKYTANLENRSNIISIEAVDNNDKISSLHRIVDARFINVNIENKTNPEKDLVLGDTAKISFKGINLPVYKLATIYNPAPNAWGGKGSFVEYKNDKLGEFKGRSGQYDLATKNAFEVEFKEAGNYTFSSPNGIFTSWWGSKLGSDLSASGPGEPNLNADILEGYFSKMPNFQIAVKEKTSSPTISLDKEAVELMVGKTVPVAATVKPESEKDKLNWTSANKEIATVDKDGTITGKKIGETEVKASIGDIISTVKITVKENEADKKLKEQKENANTSLASYKDSKNYRKTQQQEIESTLNYSKAKIDQAQDKEAIDIIVEETKAKLDVFKTDKDLTTEESKGDFVTFSLEKFTIGQGFIIEPVRVPYKKDENVAQLFDRMTKENKLDYWNAGSLTKSFYLQGIENVDTLNINIPNYIPENLNGPTTKEALSTGKTEKDLAEFDYSEGSGWYYLVNGSAANVGMSDWKVKPNQVIRIAFTLTWGEDLSGTNFGEGLSKISVSNKDEGLKLLANFNARSDKKQLLENKKIKDAYDTLFAKIQNTVIPQIEFNQAVIEFNQALKDIPADDLTPYKETANKSLATYKDPKDYRKTEQGQLSSILKESKVTIDKAADKVAVDAVVKEAKSQLDAIKTDKELTNAENEVKAKELVAYKEIANKSLAAYKDPKDYRKTEQEQLGNILKESKVTIDKATDKVAVDAVVKEAKSQLDAIKTDKELTDAENEVKAKELVAYKETANKSLAAYKNPKNYRKEEQEQLSNILKESKVTIDKAADKIAVDSIKKNTEAQLDKVKTSKEITGPQGPYIKDGRYVTINKKGFSTWSNFAWKERNKSDKMLNQTYQARGKYNHDNGAVYLSLFDNKGKWHGYINEKAVKIGDGQQGTYISDGRYVTISKNNYSTWSNFSWKKRDRSNNILNQTFQAKGRYQHFNGDVYYSLYNSKGKWFGYINANATKVGTGKQGAYISDGRKVTINKKGYNTWSNFAWKKRQSTNNLINKTFTAKGKYNHINGTTYYSLYDNKGKWYGYVSQHAVK